MAEKEKFFDKAWVLRHVEKAASNDRASAILCEFEQAENELVGKAVILSDGKAGTIAQVWLDELHGLRISIEGQDGKWPVSTIRRARPFAFDEEATDRAPKHRTPKGELSRK